MEIREDKEKKKKERGATMLEYSLLTALLGVGLISGVTSMSQKSCITLSKATCAMRLSRLSNDPKLSGLVNRCATDDTFAMAWSGGLQLCGFKPLKPPSRN